MGWKARDTYGSCVFVGIVWSSGKRWDELMGVVGDSVHILVVVSVLMEARRGPLYGGAHCAWTGQCRLVKSISILLGI